MTFSKELIALRPVSGDAVLTAFGVVAALVMVVSYGLEWRGAIWVATFAVGCSSGGHLCRVDGAWVFVALELIWAGLATRRFTLLRVTTRRAGVETTLNSFARSERVHGRYVLVPMVHTLRGQTASCG